MQDSTNLKNKNLVSLGKKQRQFLGSATSRGLYLLLLPTTIYLLIFNYAPMYGVLIAFKDFKSTLGILGSPWVGMKHFLRFFNSYNSLNIIINTITIAFYQLIAGFPLPIIFAIFLNQINSKRYKKTIQMITYAPHFISTVVMVGLIQVLLMQSSGIVNILLKNFGFESINFLGDAGKFRHIYVWTGVWQSFGWSSIIYLSALSSISTDLYEAAYMDGAGKLRCILHIDIPGILPTATVLLILNAGRIMNVGFEKAFLLQNTLNLGTSEIISTYVYKIGLLNAQFSFSTAIGLFNSLVGMILLISVNYASRKLSENSLW